VVDLDQLKQILDIVKEHALSELEIEQNGLRLRVRTGLAGTVVEPPPVSAPPSAAPTVLSAPLGVVTAGGPVEPDVELAVVKSPIVGTFYGSPEPGAAPFVEVGSVVKKGQVLCIIEAMKLMNEIDSDYDGEISNIYVDNGHPVQYGERLFAIRVK
jgi:acetyl-CoA carboxylase biotin carboxyl carrier protein